MKQTQKGESQRIYWQQWLSSSNRAGGTTSRRELITSSAAIRISPDAATARDVTQLLRKTLNLSSLAEEKKNEMDDINNNNSNTNDGDDSLVLVGTLYSLPPDYVSFEHNYQSNSKNNNKQKQSKHSDPFHLVKTLSPEDNPLKMRDRMMDQLRKLQEEAPAGRSVISPKFQWYFVPSPRPPSNLHPPSPIPSCIELDGYCTSMEEEDYASDGENDHGEVDDHDSGNTLRQPLQAQLNDDTEESDKVENEMLYSSAIDTPADLLLLRALASPNTTTMTTTTTTTTNGNDTEQATQYHKEKHKRFIKEWKRSIQLSQSYSTATSPITGFLLKQSHVDKHVWRRVYCVLTDDHLWYVTRVPYSDSISTQKDMVIKEHNPLKIASKHGKISLGRALILEPNVDYTNSPLYRIPNAFEVVSSRGLSHIFRAPNQSLQQNWIQAISSKITESFENSLLAHAELIVSDESIARNKRIQICAVQPLWKEVFAKPKNTSHQQIDRSITRVLRFGLDVSEYREQCRHIQAFSTIEKDTKSLVQSTWGMATELLSTATDLATEIQRDNADNITKNTKQISRSLEVLCRHVDYIIAGQKKQFTNGESPSKISQRGADPPPMDLFDLLLSELQSFVGSSRPIPLD